MTAKRCHFALAFASKIVHFCVKNTHQVFNLTRILASQVRFATCLELVIFADKIKVPNNTALLSLAPNIQANIMPI